MADINLTGTVIYSNDGTLTTLPAITVGDTTWNISGTGSTPDKFPATGMEKVVFYNTKLEKVLQNIFVEKYTNPTLYFLPIHYTWFAYKLDTN